MRTSPRIAAAVLAGALALPAAAEQPEVKNPDVAAVVKGNNEFAFDLYGRLRSTEGNLFFSPGSIVTALAMAEAGARGDTAEEMARALHFTLPPDRLHPALAALSREWNGADRKRGYQLNVANALWGQQGESFQADYLRLTRDNYGGGFREVDFAHATEEARQEINAWVAKQTNDKVKDLLQPGILKPLTRLVLTNAIAFKGEWHSRFKKDLTRDEPSLVGDAKVKVPMMHQTAEFGYADAGPVQVLELPYAGKELSMVVLLPKKPDGLADQETTLTADKLAGWLDKLRRQEVIVSLPRFKTASEFTLSGPLQALGMKKAFQMPGADFSGINGKKDLLITAAIHKAFVDVNEEGTEAAGATAVVSGEESLPPPKPVFRADHPFVFLIRDQRNGSVLFLGRVVDPTR